MQTVNLELSLWYGSYLSSFSNYLIITAFLSLKNYSVTLYDCSIFI